MDCPGWTIENGPPLPDRREDCVSVTLFPALVLFLLLMETVPHSVAPVDCAYAVRVARVRAMHTQCKRTLCA